MGYYETYCQICGVSFAIARNRRADEPHSAAWDYTGSAYAGDPEWEVFKETCGDGTGSSCKILDNGPHGYQHLAGPGCASIHGYSGFRISVEEMQGCRAVQALAEKEEGWQPEADDESFEVESQFVLTGVGDGSPDSSPLQGIRPARHGISSVWIGNVSEEHLSSTRPVGGLPFHPTCFQIFKKVSLLRLGNVDVQGLWDWRERDWSFEKMYEEFKGEMPRTRAVILARQLWWLHEPGCEYLAANPVNIPGLPALLKSSQSRFGDYPKEMFGPKSKHSQIYESSEGFRAGSADPFRSVPTEITSMVLEYLSSKDIASLRLATRAVRQVPQLVFRRLLLEDMPWMWEVEEMVTGKIAGWHQLYCAIKFDWAGLKGLQNRKRIWNDAEEIVRRIGQYRSDMDSLSIGQHRSDMDSLRVLLANIL